MNKRQEAIKAGAIHYFTGRPCKHGHMAPRYTSTAHCAECIRQAQERTRQAIRAGRAQAEAREHA